MIQVKTFIQSDILATREAINLLRMEIEKNQPASTILLDFSDISQISRSAADALLKLRQDYQKINTILEFAHLNEFNRKMVDLVEQQARKPKHSVASDHLPAAVFDLSKL